MRNMIVRAAALAVAAAAAAVPAMAAAAPAASASSATCLVVDTNSNHSYTSLQAAVTAAAPGDTLFVKGTCTGTTEIGKNLTITGQSASGAKTATLSGGGHGSVLTIDPGASVTLNTLVITGGSAGDGGGISTNRGTVTLNASTITGNTARFFGGGIASNFGTVTLNGSAVAGNTALSGGGGIDNGGALTISGGSTITGNTAVLNGGGILNFCGSPLVGAVDGGNVYNNTPGNIATICT